MNKKKQIKLAFDVETIAIKTQKKADAIDRYNESKIELKSKIIALLENESNTKSIRKAVEKLERKTLEIKKTEKLLKKNMSKLAKLQSKLPLEQSEETPIVEEVIQVAPIKKQKTQEPTV